VVLISKINALDQVWSTTAVRYYYYKHVSGVLVGGKVLEANLPQTAQFHLPAQAFGLMIDSGDVLGSDIVRSMHIENSRGAIIATGDSDDLMQRLISLLKVHKMSRLAALREYMMLSRTGRDVLSDAVA